MAKKGGVPMARRMTTTIALAALVAGCATAAGGGLSGPADARTKTIRTASSITAAERQQGAEAHPQLLQEFGGAYAGPQAAYVGRVGQTIAVQSGLSNARGDFTVTLLNSPVNNAFAIPGGRSEEHTSELQSLMRISYAVFC